MADNKSIYPLIDVEDINSTVYSKLDNPFNLEDILTKPNVTNLTDMITEINAGISPAATSNVFGKLIDQGKNRNNFL